MSLTPECLAQLKLRQQPFDEMPSEEFLYSDPLLESLAETAARALAAPGSVVILAGAEGSGRSIQLMRLLGAMADNYELIAFRGRPNIAFDAVDATIRNHLGAAGVDALGPDLGQLLARHSRDGEPLVLALDDAHLLGMEIIRQLLRLRSEVLEAKGHGLRLIMVGDQALSRGRLPLPDQADESQVVRLNLRPFNLEQAGAYLRHRLRVAGVDEPEVFLNSGDIAALQTSSKGMPALLNANANAWLARRCRNVGGARQVAALQPIGDLVTPSARPLIAEPPKRSPPWEVPAEPYPDQTAGDEPPGILELDRGEDRYGDDEFTDSRQTDQQLSSFLVEEDAAPGQTDLEHVLRQIRNGPPVEDKAEPQPEATASEQEKDPPAVVAAPFWSRRWFMPVLILVVLAAILVPVFVQMPTRPAWLDAGSTDAVPTNDVQPAEAGETKPFVRGLPPKSAEDEPPEAGVKEGGAQTGEEAASSADANGVTSEPSQQPQAGASAEPVQGGEAPTQAQPADAPAPAEEVKTAPVTIADLDADRAWLKEQNADGFTVQLSVVSNVAAAKAFIEKNGLTGARVIETRKRMVVVSGAFPDQGAAQQSISSLPASVRSNGPWVRTLQSLQGALR